MDVAKPSQGRETENSGTDEVAKEQREGYKGGFLERGGAPVEGVWWFGGCGR